MVGAQFAVGRVPDTLEQFGGADHVGEQDRAEEAVGVG